MSTLRSAGSVVAGATVTVVSPLPIVVGYPVFGLVTANLVGASLPMWAIAIPLLACPLLGGLTAGVLRGGDVLKRLAVGGIAGGLGVTGTGLVAGILFGVLLVGMIPHQGQPVDVSQVLVRMGLYGAGGGALLGTALGAAGGGVTALVGETEPGDGDSED